MNPKHCRDDDSKSSPANHQRLIVSGRVKSRETACTEFRCGFFSLAHPLDGHTPFATQQRRRVFFLLPETFPGFHSWVPVAPTTMGSWRPSSSYQVQLRTPNHQVEEEMQAGVGVNFPSAEKHHLNNEKNWLFRGIEGIGCYPVLWRL